MLDQLPVDVVSHVLYTKMNEQGPLSSTGWRRRFQEYLDAERTSQRAAEQLAAYIEAVKAKKRSLKSLLQAETRNTGSCSDEESDCSVGESDLVEWAQFGHEQSGASLDSAVDKALREAATAFRDIVSALQQAESNGLKDRCFNAFVAPVGALMNDELLFQPAAAGMGANTSEASIEEAFGTEEAGELSILLGCTTQRNCSDEAVCDNGAFLTSSAADACSAFRAPAAVPGHLAVPAFRDFPNFWEPDESAHNDWLDREIESFAERLRELTSSDGGTGREGRELLSTDGEGNVDSRSEPRAVTRSAPKRRLRLPLQMREHIAELCYTWAHRHEEYTWNAGAFSSCAGGRESVDTFRTGSVMRSKSQRKRDKLKQKRKQMEAGFPPNTNSHPAVNN